MRVEQRANSGSVREERSQRCLAVPDSFSPSCDTHPKMLPDWPCHSCVAPCPTVPSVFRKLSRQQFLCGERYLGRPWSGTAPLCLRDTLSFWWSTSSAGCSKPGLRDDCWGLVAYYRLFPTRECNASGDSGMLEEPTTSGMRQKDNPDRPTSKKSAVLV
ncbi:hypothetical protein L209DRAFT_534939 [Thermothelomyces heterothallicus CBS 203.75]